MTPAGETERLILKPLALADAAQIQQLFPQWEIVRYLLDVVPWPYPPDGALRFVRDIALPAVARGEAWQWTLRLKTRPRQIVGHIDLRSGNGDNRGFWIAPVWQGHGLMSEACVWANDFWFDSLGFDRLRVSKAAANTASRRISEKQGMRRIETTEMDYVSGRLPTEIWEITAAEWHDWRAAHPR